MAPFDQDPNRIDVSLNIMSDATLQAVNSLANQLAGLRELLASQGTTDPGARADAMGRAADYVRTRVEGVQAGIYHGPSGPIKDGGDTNPSNASQNSAARQAQLQQEYKAYMAGFEKGGAPSSELSPQAEQAMAHHLSDWQRWSLARKEKKAGFVGSTMDRFFELYPGASRDPFEDRAYEFEGGQSPHGGSALPEGMGLGGGSYPPQGPSGPSGPIEPGWAQALGREGITPESRLALTIPRLGEFTIQDKLNMAAQWMGRAAMRQGEYDPDTGQMVYSPGAQRAGRVAGTAAYLRDQSASIVAIQREFERVRSFARGEEQSAESLGFSRESALGDASLFGIGARLNIPGLSAASREGLRQELTQRRVQAAAGVSGEEAQRIRQVVAGMGYSGNTNERLQMDLFRNLQQRGIGPETFAPVIDQGIRQGNMSLASLRDTVIDLADAARNANMTLEEVSASSLEYAESVQQIGANYESALRNAATFTRSGLDPRIASQAMQSPMMQGILMARTGLPPQLQGIVGAPGVMDAMGQAIRQGLALGQPFANLPDRTMTSASGQQITVSTGRDAQIAMAAQTTGIPRQIIERYMRNPDFLQAGGLAQTMVGQLQDEVRGATHRERTVRKGVFEGKRDMLGRPVPTYRNVKEGYTADLTDQQRQALESGSTTDSMVQYDELEQQMIAMDPKNKDWVARVRKIRKDHGNIEERLGVAQRIIGEAVNPKPEPDYMIGLTDEARKILKIEKPKDRAEPRARANSGGAPANAAMQGPNFPSTTGGAYQYGTPGG